ncbi:hypothetical protein DYB28_007460 [Aphanomyces astaci]|uniref:Phosphoribosylformimino-5-aminoimidazole carboxamide ribotide isomerase n=1 Tax=Aphanomyces astaci TaxID=112090 RepID=A0A9X8DVK2_APHAT|nr:hypothetical protein DYB28_007460 [Aphanomyces astaci]
MQRLAQLRDVAGKDRLEDLVSCLAQWSPIPVTYAGGASSIDDVDLVGRLGKGHVDVSIGSALDIFGGSLSYDALVAYTKQTLTQH